MSVPPVDPEEHLGLVHLCAHRFTDRGIEYEELYSAGCMGLVKAARAFDPERGARFSTYAVPVILGEIRRLFRDGGTVKVSRSMKELGQRVSRERESLALSLGREPTVSEIAVRLGRTEEDIMEAMNAQAPAVSLTAEDSETDIPVDSPEEELTDKLALRQALAALPPGDRELILLRYRSNLTQVQAAAMLGMTQVQVSRREKKILAALRATLG